MVVRGTLTKAKIAGLISREVGLSRGDSLMIVHEMLDEMATSLAKSGILKVSSFGAFKVLRKKERMGRNPKTLEKFVVKEHDTVSFCPSVIVKRMINSKES